jgi:hypothetical protein
MVEHELRADWDHLEQDAWKRAADAVAPSIPPPAGQWPGMALTRSRTIRRIAKQVRERATPHEARPVAFSLDRRAEVDLADPGGPLRGRVDRIERDRDGIVVVDIKTGLAQQEISPEQRRQLLLYAALVKRSMGEWPREAVIESAAGERTGMPVVPDEADTAASEAVALLDNYNAHVESGGQATEMAKPAMDTCRYCGFRVACAPYWATINSSWPFQGAVLGQSEASLGAESGFTVTITTEAPSDRLGAVTTAYRLPRRPPPGHTLAIVGATEVGGPAVLRADWNTTAIAVATDGSLSPMREWPA